MTHIQPTTSAFGRRPVTRAQIMTQIAVKQAQARPEHEQGGVHKWAVLRMLGEIRDSLGVSDRSLGVLSALLSFHPETALTFAAGEQEGERGLIVFPSNRALTLRCNGMSEATLRRHLAALVEAGLIIRRDSPNGKRFARRDEEEGREHAFGFDLSPLVARAGEFETRLDELRHEQRHARLVKERINLLRRDLTKRIAFALDEALEGPWEGLRRVFLDLCTPLRRLRSIAEFKTLADDLERLHVRVTETLEHALAPNVDGSRQSDTQNSYGDAAHFRRRIPESNTQHLKDLEPASEEAGSEVATSGSAAAPAGIELPLKLVLEACPDLASYEFTGSGIASWRDFANLAASVRPMLGISPDAWRDAVETLGEKNAAVSVAFILQRCEHSSEASRHIGPDGRAVVTVNGSPAIRSPGGYLRALTANGGTGPFPIWPAILATLAQRVRAGRARSAP